MRDDASLRASCFASLDVLCAAHGEDVPYRGGLDAGFAFRGGRGPVLSPPKGVFRAPAQEGEAARLALAPADHALHLIVHGVLHLMGHDHEDDDEAAEMQALERQTMAGLGLHDPYPFEERAHVG